MTSIRSRLEIAAAAMGFAVVGCLIPVVGQNYFDPIPAAHVAPAPIHLLPLVTTQPSRTQPVDPHALWV